MDVGTLAIGGRVSGVILKSLRLQIKGIYQFNIKALVNLLTKVQANILLLTTRNNKASVKAGFEYEVQGV